MIAGPGGRLRAEVEIDGLDLAGRTGPARPEAVPRTRAGVRGPDRFLGRRHHPDLRRIPDRFPAGRHHGRLQGSRETAGRPVLHPRDHRGDLRAGGDGPTGPRLGRPAPRTAGADRRDPGLVAATHLHAGGLRRHDPAERSAAATGTRWGRAVRLARRAAAAAGAEMRQPHRRDRAHRVPPARLCPARSADRDDHLADDDRALQERDCRVAAGAVRRPGEHLHAATHQGRRQPVRLQGGRPGPELGRGRAVSSRRVPRAAGSARRSRR